MADAASPEVFWQTTEFIAAIVGAVVGGAISIAAQTSAERRLSRNRDYAASISLFFKLMDMHTAIAHLRAHLAEGATIAKREGMRISAATLPIANAPQPIPLSTDEKAVVLSFNDNGLLNDVLNLDRIFNVMISLCTRYDGLRGEVAAVIGGVPDHTGRVSVGLTIEDYAKVARLQFEMDGLLSSWKDMLLHDEHTSRNALTVLALQIRRRFNPHFALKDLKIVNYFGGGTPTKLGE